MKRKDLITLVERNLQAFGFKQGQWLWQPRGCQLILLINGTLRTLNLKASMRKSALLFEMGRLAGLCEAAGMERVKKVEPARPKSNGAHLNGHAPNDWAGLAGAAAAA